MPLTVADVREEIDGFAPVDGAIGWDPVGLQIGDPTAEVRSMAVCHEITDQVVGALESAPVDLVVTYHPLLFRPVRSITAGSHAEGRAYRMARTGASLLVVHTAFDSAPGGTADALAGAVGLTGTTGFYPAWRSDTYKLVTFAPPDRAEAVAAAMTRAGAGTIGNYTGCSYRSEGVGTFLPGAGAQPSVGEVGELNAQAETRVEMIVPASRRDAAVEALLAAHPYETPTFDLYAVESNAGMIGRVGTLPRPVDLTSLAESVGEALSAAVKIAGSAKGIVRVAVFPGSGGDAVAAAASAGARVLITGDVDHHQAHQAMDLGLAVIDAGHAPTEGPGVRSLYDLVSAVGPDTVDLTFIDPNPWQEVAWRS